MIDNISSLADQLDAACLEFCSSMSPEQANNIIMLCDCLKAAATAYLIRLKREFEESEE